MAALRGDQYMKVPSQSKANYVRHSRVNVTSSSPNILLRSTVAIAVGLTQTLIQWPLANQLRTGAWQSRRRSFLHWKSRMTKTFDMEVFMAGILTGAHAIRQRHSRQAKAIQIAIFGRWHVNNPWTRQRKHLVWFLNRQLDDHSQSTCQPYLLTTRLLTKR